MFQPPVCSQESKYLLCSLLLVFLTVSFCWSLVLVSEFVTTRVAHQSKAVMFSEVFVCVSVYVSVHLSVTLSFCVSVYMSVHLSVNLSLCVCLSMCLSICMSI